ncbi:MAG: ABC transporter permease [Rhodocyclales bacterium]|nr:ABC transporter permease [Rhodocyclales bacterium]
MTLPLRWGRRLLPVSAVLAFLGLWQWSAGHYPPDQLPSPLDVAAGFRELTESGALFEHIRISLLRFATAYGLAAAVAIPLGLLLGGYAPAGRACDPLLQLLRPISPIAWFPLAVLWFGIGNPPAIFIIFLAAFFPILLATISGVRDVEPLHLKVASNFGAGRVFTFVAVVLPAAFPHVMVGLHIALGTAWIHLVAGEMLGAQSGLGYLIVDARNFLRTDLIIAGMLLVGALGLAINGAMRRAEGVVRRRWGAV